MRLAAYLGHPAAGRAFPGVQPGDPADREQWLYGLQGWGKPLLVRAALALAHAVLPVFEERLTHDERPRRAVDAAEAWLASNTQAHRVAAGLAAELADDSAREASVDPEADDDSAFAAYTCRDAAWSAAGVTDLNALEALLRAADDAGAVLFEGDRLVQALREPLLRWALGD